MCVYHVHIVSAYCTHTLFSLVSVSDNIQHNRTAASTDEDSGFDIHMTCFLIMFVVSFDGTRDDSMTLNFFFISF